MRINNTIHFEGVTHTYIRPKPRQSINVTAPIPVQNTNSIVPTVPLQAQPRTVNVQKAGCGCGRR